MPSVVTFVHLQYVSKRGTSKQAITITANGVVQCLGHLSYGGGGCKKNKKPSNSFSKATAVDHEPHDLPKECTAREKRSLNVHAHLSPLSTLETFGERISASTSSGKEIAVKKRKLIINMTTRNRV